ncbi:MAG: Flp family type IVb pilin [Sphingomonas sp.]|jgi:pilus assembly protein Flp/PilA
MRRRLRLFAQDEKAATAVEYGLIVSLIVIAMIASFRNVANVTTAMWNNVSNTVASAHRGA